MEAGKGKAYLRIRSQARGWEFMWHTLRICSVELAFKEKSSARQISAVTRDITSEAGGCFAHVNQSWNKVLPFKKQSSGMGQC